MFRPAPGSSEPDVWVPTENDGAKWLFVLEILGSTILLALGTRGVPSSADQRALSGYERSVDA